MAITPFTFKRPTSAERSAFAERLKMLMHEKPINPYRLSLNLGVSRTIVNHWLKAENFPSPQNLEKLAKYFGTTANFLENGGHDTTEISQEVRSPMQSRLPDPAVIFSARSQIAAACPDATEIEILLRFKEFTVQL